MDPQKIIRELLATGLTQQQLAARVPCSQPTVSALASGKRGSRLSFAVGVRLAKLHDEICQGVPASK